MVQNKKKSGQDKGWIFLVLLVIGFLLIFWEQNPAVQKASQELLASDENQKKMSLVNRHLKETALQLEQDRLKRAAEASKVIESYRSSDQQMAHESQNDLTFDSDFNMQKLTRDLNRSHELSDDQLTPEQIVQSQLLDRQIIEKEDKAYREEYARQFVENAKAAGWDIVLSPDLEVISVKKRKSRRVPTQIFQ
jgi:hypothetical protein